MMKQKLHTVYSSVIVNKFKFLPRDKKANENQQRINSFANTSIFHNAQEFDDIILWSSSCRVYERDKNC